MKCRGVLESIFLFPGFLQGDGENSQRNENDYYPKMEYFAPRGTYKFQLLT